MGRAEFRWGGFVVGANPQRTRGMHMSPDEDDPLRGPRDDETVEDWIERLTPSPDEAMTAVHERRWKMSLAEARGIVELGVGLDDWELMEWEFAHFRLVGVQNAPVSVRSNLPTTRGIAAWEGTLLGHLVRAFVRNEGHR